ncbi:MAG: hypothetical protein EAX96_20195 [Candidatus Lokiarchaeota archaeon]|nr:hypothetical protein [Candidatus Lokiarchaeota archaeon]
MFFEILGMLCILIFIICTYFLLKPHYSSKTIFILIGIGIFCLISLYIFNGIHELLLWILAAIYVYFIYLYAFKRGELEKKVNITHFRIFLVIMFVSFLLYIFTYIIYFYRINYDEIRYLYVSEQIRRGNHEFIYYYGYGDRILILLINAIIFNFIEFSWHITRILTICFIIISSFVLYIELKKIIDPEKTVIVVGLLSTSLFVISLMSFQIDLFLLYFFIFSLLFLYKGFENDDLKEFILGFILFNVTLFIKITGIMIIPIFLIYSISRLRKDNYKKKIKYFIFFITEIVAIALLFSVFYENISQMFGTFINRVNFFDYNFLFIAFFQFFYWIGVNLFSFHGMFNIIVISFSIFQVYSFKKNNRYFDKFGVFCAIWYFTFYFYIFLEINYFQNEMFQISNFLYYGYRYDIPLFLPVYYIIARITIYFRNYFKEIYNQKIFLINKKILYRRLSISFLFGCFLFSALYSMRAQTNAYFSQYEYEKNAYVGIIKISDHLNERNFKNTTILTLDIHPNIRSLIYVITKGKYTILATSPITSNVSFFNLIESRNITDIIISEWEIPSSNYIYNYVNNSNFIIQRSYLDIASNGETKNSSLIHVVPWWL